jgi:hypothetical protein
MSSRASNLAGFSTSISPPSNLNVGVVTASSFVGNLTGNVTGTASTATAAATAYGLTGSPDITVGILTASVISVGSTTGTSGQLLQSTGTGIGWTDAPSGGVEQSEIISYNPAGIRSDSANGRLEVFGQGNFQVFTSPGTYVVNPGISSIRVRVVGAGGNGGIGGTVSPAAPDSGGSGGGGGGGGYAHKVITSFPAPRSYTVTVGTAPGGTSSFGSEVSATGGSNGGDAYSGSPPIPSPSTGTGGAGGVGSGGDVNFTGASGDGSQPGAGGAAATQLGNGSGKSVPGLPSLNHSYSVVLQPSGSGSIVMRTIRDTSISRFPFDIFNGLAGSSIPNSQGQASNGGSVIPISGFNGGGGGEGGGLGGPAAGNGGWAGGGGGGSPVGPSALAANKGRNGGIGGLGGGGGGGGGGFTSPPTGGSGTGGSGGAGIVIVEW